MALAKKLDLTRFIKNTHGDKVEMKVTSLNIELRQLEFLRENNLNLSLLIREYLDDLIKSVENSTEENNESNNPRRPK